MADLSQQLDAIFRRSEEENLSDLAIDGFKGAVGEDLVRRGKEIYASLKSKLRTTICGNDKVLAALRNPGYDRVLLAAAIVDAISGYLTGVAAANVAVLLVKEGIAAYCNLEGA